MRKYGSWVAAAILLLMLAGAAIPLLMLLGHPLAVLVLAVVGAGLYNVPKVVERFGTKAAVPYVLVLLLLLLDPTNAIAYLGVVAVASGGLFAAGWWVDRLVPRVTPATGRVTCGVCSRAVPLNARFAPCRACQAAYHPACIPPSGACATAGCKGVSALPLLSKIGNFLLGLLFLAFLLYGIVGTIKDLWTAFRSEPSDRPANTRWY